MTSGKTTFLNIYQLNKPKLVYQLTLVSVYLLLYSTGDMRGENLHRLETIILERLAILENRLDTMVNV